jgi:23S rRNA-/tRNA-specific pseudouridylate synthase
MLGEPSGERHDDGLWVVNKPTGWLVHPANGTDAPNLVDWLVSQGASPEVAPVHRLDLPTSGIVLFCESSALRGALGRFFVDGLVDKRYVALVHGRTRSKGIIKKPLDDERRGRPLDAITRYRTREHLGGFSLITARPATGRKHQIRRHMHSLRHPLVGDERYRSEKFVPVPAFPGRLWLHSERLNLPDGRSFAVSLPPELATHLEVLRGAGQTGTDEV